MKFSKLRLLGFKSFVEPTEFHIEDGLTGVVGPNGCGKSNLVEALRWVMGENSYKNMRASGMDDVIFSGSGNRPARNTAEVGLFLDNDDRTAPPAFNDAEELQVMRRIERESGSVYRINGKDVRAKDVQLLFADASTGARSPSMVGQGRIGELISAKPQARRALLEEAAGISGLHSRRHEAELRLRAAETNLERLDDVISQLESQIDSLKRQARQANRYRTVSDDIRKTEALLFHLRWVSAKKAVGEAESGLSAATSAVAEAAQTQTTAAKEQAIIAHKLPGLRDDEVKSAAALQRLTIERKQIEDEISRAASRKEELQKRIDQLDGDVEREEKLVGDNQDFLNRLDDEENDLKHKSQQVVDREKETRQVLEQATARLDASEKRLSDLTTKHAGEQARKQQLERNLKEAQDRQNRLQGQLDRAKANLEQVLGEISALGAIKEIQDQVESLQTKHTDAQSGQDKYIQDIETARQQEFAFREPVNVCEAGLKEIQAEARAIRNLLNQNSGELFPGVLEQIKVEPGYEKALGAALDSDLDAPTDRSAPAFWQTLDIDDKIALPDGVSALGTVVTGPPELNRRLAQIGIIDKDVGDGLIGQLRPGQRLVSIEGDLWRWDGFQASADAPTAAAQRLEYQNQLTQLDDAANQKMVELRAVEKDLETANARTAQAVENEKAGREAVRAIYMELEDARAVLLKTERSVSQYTSRKAGLEDQIGRLSGDIGENDRALNDVNVGLGQIGDISHLVSELEGVKTQVAEDRAALAQARATAEGLSREAEARGRRLEAIIGERENWQRRISNAGKQIVTLKNRREEANAQLVEVTNLPDEANQKRRALVVQLEKIEAVRKEASDVLATAEAAQATADKIAKAAIDALSAVKEDRARAEERVNSANERLMEVKARIVEELECSAESAFSLTGLAPDSRLPNAGDTERKLEKLKSDRERLGAVNLRADMEQTEITEQRDALVSERDDLIEAIRKLRLGIASLNKEGRERLLAAFDEVNEQFKRLFTHLFGGGTAELQLVESDDPLEAGLEILARPPGKKPQTMTLLSGGEQALTAMALIFAVFLTNPAPICVLDEVDAPLDDHNVERFCNLMDEMASSTATRFVIITHNPITMARMNRLFGVTMAERGVSQLVSVDLQQAEVLVEAS